MDDITSKPEDLEDLEALTPEDRETLREFNIEQLSDSPEIRDVLFNRKDIVETILSSRDSKDLRKNLQMGSRRLAKQLLKKKQ